MISRSSAAALAFACLATLSVAVAAEARHADLTQARARPAAAMQVVQLPRVVVTGRIQREATAP